MRGDINLLFLEFNIGVEDPEARYIKLRETLVVGAEESFFSSLSMEVNIGRKHIQPLTSLKE